VLKQSKWAQNVRIHTEMAKKKCEISYIFGHKNFEIPDKSRIFASEKGTKTDLYFEKI
jgi:hypothetical protein